MDDQNDFLTFVQKSFAHDIAGAIPAQLPPDYPPRPKEHLSGERQPRIHEHPDYPEGSLGGSLIGSTGPRRFWR